MPFYAHLLLLLAGLADRATHLGGSPHLSCKRDQIKMRDYMDRWVTPPKRVTSPTWGLPPPCKQALNLLLIYHSFWRHRCRRFLSSLSREGEGSNKCIRELHSLCYVFPNCFNEL